MTYNMNKYQHMGWKALTMLFMMCLTFTGTTALTSCSSDEDPFFTVSENDDPRILNTDLADQTLDRLTKLNIEIKVTPIKYTTVTWLLDGVQIAVIHRAVRTHHAVARQGVFSAVLQNLQILGDHLGHHPRADAAHLQMARLPQLIYPQRARRVHPRDGDAVALHPHLLQVARGRPLDQRLQIPVQPTGAQRVHAVKLLLPLAAMVRQQEKRGDQRCAQRKISQIWHY